MNKRPYPRLIVWLFALIIMLFLVACERPIPRDGAPAEETPAGTVDPNAIPPATLAIPTPAGVEPTAYPGPDGGESTGDNGEGGTPTTETEGGTEGAPAATTAPLPETPTETSHTIGAGDTLYALSLLYDVSIEAIVAANNLANPDDLEIGQVLIIPPPGTDAADVAQEPDSTTDPAAGGDGTAERVHIVQAGENLFRIGLQYGFSVEELSTYNSITNPDSLEVGQEIRIPPDN